VRRVDFCRATVCFTARAELVGLGPLAEAGGPDRPLSFASLLDLLLLDAFNPDDAEAGVFIDPTVRLKFLLFRL
jgi:hypothetical protein